MGVTVNECDPDVNVKCDCCDKYFTGSIFCSKCANRPSDEQNQCVTCKEWFGRFEMFSKVPGLMCHGCAFKHEMSVLEQKKTA